MTETILLFDSFELDWADERSHECLVIPHDAPSHIAEIGNIFTPPGWMTWFKHEPGKWDQPEVCDAWKNIDPNRVHSGEKGMLFFTFFRRHWGGFYKQVQVTPGQTIRLTAWAHAWSNHETSQVSGCYENGRCSNGVGKEAAYILEGDAPEHNGDPWNDAIDNFTFSLGIDPTGGTNPTAGTVIWGRGAHIYNTHAQPPSVEVVAESDVVTIFLRSKTRWAFKHNDAYWDDVQLVAIDGPTPPPEPSPEPEPEPVGGPRVQYERTYVLLPQSAGPEWANAVINATWKGHRYTIGSSADDAGIGDLSK